MLICPFYPVRTGLKMLGIQNAYEEGEDAEVTGRFRLGCDIGGTFTDFVLFDSATGALHFEKCLTTPDDPSVGVIAGVRLLEQKVAGFLADTDQVFHGTTLVINAVVERKGAKTALLTTEGFRDVVEIATERRYDLYDLQQLYPKPLVPRNLRRGIRERIRSDGRVLTPLDTEQVEATVADFAREGIESVAVCFLHSYRNPVHEERVREQLQKVLPRASVSISSEVLPEINEYARTSTTIVNAYTRPLMERYLSRLQRRLKEDGLKGELLVMLSSGGVASLDTASRFPVRVIESGPVGGVILGQHLKQLAAINQALAFDMGGTTAKVCLLIGDSPLRASEYEVAREHRFKAGSGIPIKVPCVDLLEIGAGGGSIAKIGPLGLLEIGPESASAMPGPACYGQGGTRPTVTDADLVLGYLNGDFFLGGSMRLDTAAARQALDEHIARKLDIDTVRAAWGIHDFVNENMASATRMYTAERGVDPSTLALIASGGAGPVHCYGVARKLGIRQIIIPVGVGVASALGFLTAPVSYDLVRTCKMPVEGADLTHAEELFRTMQEEAARILRNAGEAGPLTFLRSADVRYVGQGYEINVPLGEISLDEVDEAALISLFRESYERLFGRAFASNQFELVNLRLVARGTDPQSPLRHRVGTKGTPLKGVRPAYAPEVRAFVEHRVYDRYALAPGTIIAGPAIIEERESTTIVGTGGTARVDEFGVMHVTVGAG